MDDQERQSFERLRHQIGGLRDQVERLGNSLQSIIRANRTEWENYRLEAIEPYKEKALQALDSVGRHPFGGDQWLQKLDTLEEELKALLSEDSSTAHPSEPSEAIEEQPEAKQDEQAELKMESSQKAYAEKPEPD